MSSAVLSTEKLSKRYGALIVTDDVSLAVARSSIHALIGPNGAGKSTLIGQLMGELHPDSGRILFKGQDVTRVSPEQRARTGISRSYQISATFPEFSVIENVTLALQMRRTRLPDVWRNALSDSAIANDAHRALEQVRLTNRAKIPAARLSYGEKRQLEMAMVISQGPEVLLLDEPLAGLGPHESEEIVALIDGLRQHYAMLLVEHDMHAVFSLADRISVLVRGQIIASGTAAEIRRNEGVRTAYLGDEEIPVR